MSIGWRELWIRKILIHRFAAGRIRHILFGHPECMKRGNWANDLTAISDASLDGVISRRTLEESGIAPSTIWARCQEGGSWQRVLPGVVLLHNAKPTTVQRYLAALAYGGPQAVITSFSALKIAGYDVPTHNDVHLLIPDEVRRRSVSFVKVERTIRLPTASRRGNLRYAPPVRGLLDASRATITPSQCQSLFMAGIQRGDVTMNDLAQELAAGSSRGSALPRSIIRDLGNDAHSVAELQAQTLYATSGLPAMTHNVDIYDSVGRWVARPDGWIDDVALAWEIDSLRHHFTVESHRQTVERRARMQRSGIIVVSTLPQQLTADPRTVLADLHAAHDLARSRPRPAIFLRASA